MPSSQDNEACSDADVDHIDITRPVAFAMLFGPGAAIGFYISMVGFYVANFKSRLFFLVMLFCLFIPGPLVWFLQQRFDAEFDTHYGARATYFFRLAIGQGIIACICICWALMPQMPYTVLVIGVLIGFFSQAVLSSSLQVLSTMNPSLTSYASIGYLAGSATPVIIFFAYGFAPTSTLHTFQLAVYTVPAVCFLSCALLGFLHSSSSIFQNAYDRLGENSQEEVRRRSSSNFSTDAESKVDEIIPLIRQVSSEGEVPAWVWVWCAYNTFSVSLGMSLVSLAAFFGDTSLAQTLSLLKLFTDFTGCCVAIPIAQLECFQRGPWHKCLVFCGIGRAALFGILVIHLYGHTLSQTILILVWIAFHGTQATCGPLMSVTISIFVHVSDRKRVQRANMGSFFAGLVIGLVFAASVVIPVLDLGTHWPDSRHTIPAHGASSLETTAIILH